MLRFFGNREEEDGGGDGEQDDDKPRGRLYPALDRLDLWDMDDDVDVDNLFCCVVNFSIVVGNCDAVMQSTRS